MIGARENVRPAPDELMAQIADYVASYTVDSEAAYETARYCLMDSLGCAVLALRYPECLKLLGPVVPGTSVPNGSRVPGTDFELDPIAAAFNIGACIRWLDFNDTWLASEWGHPSDNLGAILAVADFLSRTRTAENKPPILVRDVLTAMIKAHEIQGVLALENSFNQVGLDHVILVRVASTAVVTGMLGGTREQIINAVSNAWLDGGALRTYRHAPNTGSRKSWAAGDATSRGVFHAINAIRGEMGYPSALTANRWGFCDALFGGQPIRLARPLGSYVMEHVLFKIAFPAEFHAQTAIEAAFKLHAVVQNRLDDIERVEITTQESAIRIIDKTGPLYNPADRDHCLQYMVAVALIFGRVTADSYSDDTARDPRIDALREKMSVQENKRYSVDYLDSDKRSIANAVQVFFKTGECTEKVEVEYPLGHKRRRAEAIPLLMDKFQKNLETHFDAAQAAKILVACSDSKKLANMRVHDFVALLVPSKKR